jgi:hypothetical protein
VKVCTVTVGVDWDAVPVMTYGSSTVPEPLTSRETEAVSRVSK